MPDIVLIFLTCADQQQAHLISKTLLEKNLIACAKFSEIQSQFLWNGALDNSIFMEWCVG